MLAAPGVAQARFTHASLLSGTPTMQFTKATVPAMSASGEYVAFQGEVGGVGGIYRRNVLSDEVTLVAGADSYAPSISANGQYIAFTSTEDLVPWRESGLERVGVPPADVGCPEVYVRNMDPAEGEPAVRLASALDPSDAVNGSKEEGINFETGGGTGCEPVKGLPMAGAQAAAAVALSGSGQEVAFTVLSKSDFPAAGTAPGQVLVRNLETNTTTLVTQDEAGDPAVGGGAFPDEYTLTQTPARFSSVGLEQSSAAYGDQPSGSTAAISADGSTVAWVGMNVSSQVSPAEAARSPSLVGESAESEAEPLWRRIADGTPVTRRLLAGAGLEFFTNNPARNGTDNPAEYGAYVGTSQTVFVPPALSENGEAVAVVATAPGPAAEASLVGRNTGLSELNSDAYVVHVDDDPASPPQTRPVSEIKSYAVQQSEIEDVKDVAISPDGTRVALFTGRTPLESPTLALISPPPRQFLTELYAANLELGTLQRVIAAYDGGEPNDSSGMASFSGDGRSLAFASSATNLFFGDGVSGSEIYESHEVAESAQVVASQIGEPPLFALPAPSWTLSATATAEHDGSVVVQAEVPGAGSLQSEALAQLPKQSAVAKSSRSHSRRSGKRASQPVRLLTVTVAHATTAVAAPVEVSLRLRVGAQYKALLLSPNGLYTVLRVAFAAPGHPTLVKDIPVTFREVAPKVVKRQGKDVRRKRSAKVDGRGEHRKLEATRG
jgi:hypothetical protein